jgi:tripartite-type tricarboxylate transporter receptor subunit TctC
LISFQLQRRAVLAMSFATVVGVLGMTGTSTAAQTAWKPERPVTLVVPYSPGGGTDAQARAVANELQRIWGQPVIVENMPGADGAIGTRKVTEAKPDGYTLLVQLPSITLMKHVPGSNGFDPLAKLTPVSAFSALPAVFVSNTKLPGRTLREVVSNCKTATQPCSIGTTENAARLQAKQLAAEEGIKELTIVNYKGGGQLITDLVANNVNMGIMGLTSALPHAKAGTLRILATFGSKRVPGIGDIPSTLEAGFPSYSATTWYGLFAPRATPPAVVQAIASAVTEAVKGETTTKSFASIGAQAIGSTPLEFATMVKDESTRMDSLAQRFPFE